MAELLLATVGSYNSANGTTIKLDGQNYANAKYYKRLSSYTPAAGDRIVVMKDSGTYVILGKVVI